MQYLGNKGNYFRDTPVTVPPVCPGVDSVHYTWEHSRLVKMSQIKHMSS